MLGALQERKRDVKNLLAQAVLAVAFGTGLRKGELQGLKWEHSKLLKDGSAKIAVEQSVWHGQIVGVKTESSADEVTLGPDFVEYVEQYRAAIGGLNSGFMFGYSGGRPIDLDSFRKWVMLPLLNRCAVYKKPESQHGERFRLSSGSRDEARVQT
jgi:integrase